jgi:NAD(P)-dependent dehydrogenase (short-subunit alcohol dehydrogenase family)
VQDTDARQIARSLRVSTKSAKGMNPMKRFGDPREIAETVLFLASDGAGYINGQVIHVEGGWVPAG